MDVLSGRGLQTNAFCLKVVHMQIDRLVSYRVHVRRLESAHEQPSGNV